MKTNKFLTLMVALAAGSAGAAGVAAGTQITNVATATFDNPDGTGPKKVSSNTVTTIVLPKPMFDITYADGKADGGDQTAFDTTTVIVNNGKAGKPVATKYVLTNMGNVELTVDIKADTDRTGSSKTNAGDVKYYSNDADLNKDGILTEDEIARATEIQRLDIAVDEKKDFFQVVTIPANAGNGDVYGASPEGIVNGVPTGAGQLGNGFQGKLFEEQTTTILNDGRIDINPLKAENEDLQYVKVTLIRPNLTNTPPTAPNNPTPSNPGVPSVPVPPVTADPNGKVVVPPTTPGTVDPNVPGTGVPTQPVTPLKPGTPPGQNVPLVPGYVDPKGPGGQDRPTPIEIKNDEQHAYPPADEDDLPDTVTFVNEATSKNTDDTVTITATPDGSDGVTATIIGAYTVDAGGVATPVDDAEPGKDGFQVTIPANGKVVYFTKVTYPDKDNSPTKRDPININLKVTSGNNPNVSVETKDVVHPPAMLFGDERKTELGGDPTPVVSQVVIPGAGKVANEVNPLNGNDERAVFPMEVANTGDYNDTYTLEGTIAGLPGVNVIYVDAQGNELPKGPNGTFLTPVLAPGQEYTAYAIVDVPMVVPAGKHVLTQTAKASFSGIVITDNNDEVVIGSTGDFTLAKFIQSAIPGKPDQDTEFVGSNGTAVNAGDKNAVGNPAGFTSGSAYHLPGAKYDYKIIAKNFYNTTLKNVAIQDDVDVNLVVNSVQCTLFAADGSQVSDVAGQFNPVAGAKTNVTCAPVELQSGQYYLMTLNVHIKDIK